jgi:anti-sigma factor (TIGR02949 family)
VAKARLGIEGPLERPDQYTCEQALRKLDDYLDRELAPDEMELVRRHLEVCAHCASDYGALSGIVEEVKAKLRRVHVPAELTDQVFRALAPRYGER